MRTDEYRRIYELEETHWWYRGLRELILTFAVPTLNAANLVLDCGCGTGIVLKTFSKFTRVVGIDLSSEALSFCKFRKITSISKADTTNLPFQDEAFDTILSLDVLYHRWVDDDSSALSEYYRLLKPAGTLLLNLPAYRFLYGGHDLVVETKRRYTVGEISDLPPLMCPHPELGCGC
jgi:ubiquinone/menaquinone biosynthesis C-methylase UbiE